MGFVYKIYSDDEKLIAFTFNVHIVIESDINIQEHKLFNFM